MVGRSCRRLRGKSPSRRSKQVPRGRNGGRKATSDLVHPVRSFAWGKENHPIHHFHPSGLLRPDTCSSTLPSHALDNWSIECNQRRRRRKELGRYFGRSYEEREQAQAKRKETQLICERSKLSTFYKTWLCTAFVSNMRLMRSPTSVVQQKMKGSPCALYGGRGNDCACWTRAGNNFLWVELPSLCKV